MFVNSKFKIFNSILSLLLIFALVWAPLATVGFPFDIIHTALENSKLIDSVPFLKHFVDRVTDSFKTKTALASHGPRVRTVEFFAGQYASVTLQNQNAINSFPSQTFQLAENSVDIVDAYIEVTAQIGAAVTTNYNESFIYFDACIPACTPSLTAFTTTAGLGGTSGESQTVRFRAKVDTETEMAAYIGGGANRTFQIGYCFDTTAGGGCAGTTSLNIQGANAKLVITYTYDHTSLTQTNTVIYPLDSGTDIGSKTALQIDCTIDSNCPTFSYNAVIPEIATQLSQWFSLQTSIDTSTITNWQTISDIGGNPGNTNTPPVSSHQALSSNGGWVDVLQSGVVGYANNSVQLLEMSTTNTTSAFVMGGENYVTYTYAGSAPTRTKTVVYPVGEVQTTGSLTKSALVGPTVFFPETGVNVEKAWFRVHATAGNITAATTLNLTYKVGNNAESAVRGYAFGEDTASVSDDGYFIYLIPASEYTELEGATGLIGKAAQMTAQWVTTARGAVSAELVVTYTYTGESGGYMVTQKLFAGQQITAPATSFSTAVGAINPTIPETSGVTIRGASLRLASKGHALAVPAANEGVGANLTLASCTPVITSTAVVDNENTRLNLWKNVTSTVTNNDATTYTACYITTEASVHGGTLTVTYQVDITPSNTLTVSTSGSQPTFVVEGQNNRMLGVFTFITSVGLATISSITIREANPAFTASGNLTDVRLYQKPETPSCTFAGSTPLGAPASFVGEAAVFGSLGLAVNTSQICVFIEADVSVSAGAGSTFEIEITGSGDITASGGTVVGIPSFPLQIAGATTIRADQGTVMSSPIDFDWVTGQATWGTVVWSTTETEGDVKLRVYYNSLGTVAGVTDCDTPVLDAVLPGNAAGFDFSVTPTINIAGLIPVATTYNRLCLQATLFPGSTLSPTLNDWRVTWQPPGGGNLSQSGYRWFTDQNSLDVGAFLAGQNTPHTLTANGQDVRLRILMHSNNGLAQSGQTFKLQYVGKGTGSCAVPVGGTPIGWTDISNSTLIALYNNPLPVDDNSLTPDGNDPQHLTHTTNNQTYNDSDSDPPATVDTFIDSVAPGISAGNDGMWDFALFDSTAPSAKTYCLRMVTSAGAVLDDGYSVYPEVTTAVQYPLTGTYTSNDINITPLRAWNVLEWNWEINPACTIPSPCNLRIQIRTATTQAGLGTALWSGPTGAGDFYQGPAGAAVTNRVRIPVTHNTHQWLRYQVLFDSNGAYTPILNRVRINYQ